MIVASPEIASVALSSRQKPRFMGHPRKSGLPIAMTRGLNKTPDFLGTPAPAATQPMSEKRPQAVFPN
jgi:hypothetical protein